QVGGAVDVFLVVLLIAAALGLTVVEFGFQRGQAVFLALEFGLEDAAGVAVAGALVGRVDLRSGRAGGSAVRQGTRLRARDHRDRSFEHRAALVLRFLRRHRV